MDTISVPQPATQRTIRQERGIVLFRELGDEIRHIEGRLWVVPSCTGGTRYLVDLKHQRCECPDTPPAGEVCKHTIAATIARAKSGGCAGCSRVVRYRNMHAVVGDHLMFFEGDQVCESCGLAYGVL